MKMSYDRGAWGWRASSGKPDTPGQKARQARKARQTLLPRARNPGLRQGQHGLDTLDGRDNSTDTTEGVCGDDHGLGVEREEGRMVSQ